MALRIPAFLDELEEEEEGRWSRKESKVEKEFPPILKELSDDDWEAIMELLNVCIGKGDKAYMELMACKIIEKRKVIDWKKRPHLVDILFEALVKRSITDPGKTSLYLTNFTKKLFQAIKANKLMKEKKPVMFDIMMKSNEYRERELEIHDVARSIAVDYPFKEEDHDNMYALLESTAKCIYADPDMTSNADARMKIWMIFIKTFQQASLQLLLKLTPIIQEVFNFCKDQEWFEEDRPDKNSLSYEMLKMIMQDCLNRHHSATELLKPCMDTVKELWECGDDTLERDANHIMQGVAGNVELAGDQSDILIDRYFTGEDGRIITKFSSMYPQMPEKFIARADDLVGCLKTCEQWQKSSIFQLLTLIAKDNADVFTKDSIDTVAFYLDEENTVHSVFQLLIPLAEKSPSMVIVHEDAVVDAIGKLKGMGLGGMPILVQLAKLSEKSAKKYMDFFVSMLPQIETMFKMSLIYYMRTIGQSWVKVLAEHRELLEELAKDSSLKDSANSCIDVIEGRSLGGVAAEVSDTKQDVENLEERVGDTEENVENIARQVDENTENITVVTTNVEEQEERLDAVEETVEETVVKVEELDHKTLSHAPMWARDIAELLNPPGDHDWRLLSTRLGYTNDDIRNWATQANPCLSMFDEWFATNKTREATYGVLKQLQEMDQDQAAMIVENSLKAAEGVVEDEEEDFSEPPAIFISYQWGHQDEVKLLKRHLEMAGYEAWMDIGQMGGGDKLFQKIDQGIRAAKVIISCVTEKYAKSPNCNREMNLSVNLGKQVIPLLMEDMSWPPAGAMGPIFGEFLYIKFFEEYYEDNVYWPKSNFQQLLMQLRYTVVPNDELIADEYKGWTDPPEEIITIKPRKKTKERESSAQDNQPNQIIETESRPEVFISYQWDRQPDIKALYGKLTSEGFNCWLDIMQMGGGDSLYDKIDKGIRNCQIVVSCVTSKYSLSANCRREVSLADALKKPIIPLLLDNMTWPPEGPMSMVLTQLLYIDFCKVKGGNWDVDEFESLLEKITGNLTPETRMILFGEDSGIDSNEEHSYNVSEDVLLKEIMNISNSDNEDDNLGDEDSEHMSDAVSDKSEAKETTPEIEVPVIAKQKVTPTQEEAIYNQSIFETPPPAAYAAPVVAPPKSSCCNIQ